MKKFIIPFISLLGMLTACTGSSNQNYDSFYILVETYNVVTFQNKLALDPFNVAFRLNTYLEEGETDAIKRELFPADITIETKDNKTYTITYGMATEVPEKDLLREGRLIIQTNGSLLNEENALWTVVTDPDKPYFIGSADQGAWGVELAEGEYVISNIEKNKWNIAGDKLYLYLVGYNTNISSWNVDMNITQVNGAAKSLENARFMIESGNSGHNVGTVAGMSLPLRYEILEPIRYAEECPYLKHSGGKELIISLDKNWYIHSTSDTMIYNFGKSWDTCMPEYKITAKPDSLWETHYYDALGNLLRTERSKILFEL